MRLKRLLIAGAMLGLCGHAGAYAQNSLPDLVAACRAVASKDDRLQCFDSIPTISVRPIQEDDPDRLAGWEFKSATDKLTDEKRFLVSRPEATGKGLIVIKCDSPGKNSLYVHIIVNQYLGSIGNRTSAHVLKYRFGKEQVISVDYLPSDKSAAILDATAVKRFLRIAKGESRLVVAATGYDYKSVELEFDMAGAKTAIEKVAKSCRD